jgi:hypothetical protein
LFLPQNARVKDATELIEAGYEYVCDVDNVKLFRKRKVSLWVYPESMDVC